MKIDEAIDKLIIALLAEGVKKVTIKWYRVRFARFIKEFKSRDVEEISIDEIRSFLANIREEPISPHYFYSHVRVIRRLFKWLYEERWIDNPFWKRIKLPKLPPQEPKGVDIDDVRRMINACDDSEAGLRDKAIILFLIDTGCRVGGLCSIKMDGIDLDKLIATVKEKGGEYRKVLFNERTRNAIEDWISNRNFDESEYLFTSLKEDIPMNPNSVIQMLRRLGNKAGVQGRVNPHAFRHGFAREYLKSGGDISSVRDLLGHKDIGVTKNFYAVFVLEEHREKHKTFSPVNLL
jgi:integrase/recombinase XerD